MAPEPVQDVVGLQLPVGVVGPGDLRRLSRELEELEDALQQMRLRAGAPADKLPRASRLLEEFASVNRLNLLVADDRQRMAAYLGHTLANAPVLHMSFAAAASRKFVTEIIRWLRTNLQPDVLLEIGLEPSLAAGCVLRTPNHHYDFSLRARLESQADVLLKKLQAVAETEQKEPAA